MGVVVETCVKFLGVGLRSTPLVCRLGWPRLCLIKTIQSELEATTTIATAFKISFSHRKNGPPNRLPLKVGFCVLATRSLHRARRHHGALRSPKTFLRLEFNFKLPWDLAFPPGIFL
jgi:hypothetical protein